MAVNTNAPDGAPSPSDNNRDQTASAPAGGATFSGTGFGTSSAPDGSLDIMSMLANMGLSRIDAAVEPYLNEVLKLLQNQDKDIRMESMPRNPNAFAFRKDTPDGVANLFGIYFVQAGETASANYTPISQRIGGMRQDLQNQYVAAGQKFRMVDARVILATYEPEMARTREMAATIQSAFTVATNATYRNAQLGQLVRDEFAVSWSVSEARQIENMISPHGVRPRMDIGMVLSAKVKTNMGDTRDFRDQDTQMVPIGVIGGYVDIRPEEMFPVPNGSGGVSMYQPVVNITTCLSFLPLEGIGAIMLALFAPNAYNGTYWMSQWRDMSPGNPNPGNLDVDPENRGKVLELHSAKELESFARARFAKPQIVFQFQDGRDNIPGMQRLSLDNVEQKQHFMERLTNFFDVGSADARGVVLSVTIEPRHDGVYGDMKGTLRDSREVDLLALLARSGAGSVDGDIRSIMMSGGNSPADRARIIQEHTGTFMPLYFDTQAVLNPAFVDWIGKTAQSKGLTVQDTSIRNQGRSMGSFTTGFGNAGDVQPITSSGIGNRFGGAQSIWNFSGNR